jgi:hypothetical protein
MSSTIDTELEAFIEQCIGLFRTRCKATRNRC